MIAENGEKILRAKDARDVVAVASVFTGDVERFGFGLVVVPSLNLNPAL
jgi:hypothetical protein